VKKNKSTDEVDKDSLREQQDGEKEDHQNGMEIEEAPGVDVVTVRMRILKMFAQWTMPDVFFV